MKCTRCGLKEARVHVAGVGHFCLDCNNALVSELLGTKAFVDFDREISVSDSDGAVHRFEISNTISPGFSVWKAEEIGGEYMFEVLVRPEENQAEAVEYLHRKIIKGIGYKTLEDVPKNYRIENAINVEKEQYNLKSIGTLRIEYGGENDTVSLIIDGKRIGLNDFGIALTAFEGFNMDFLIKDPYEDILGKNTVLKLVSIDPNAIMDSFERTLSWFLDGDFLSYKCASACEDALFERVEMLEILYRYGDRKVAVKLAEQIKSRLLSIDHDTDYFPEYIIELIEQAVPEIEEED